MAIKFIKNKIQQKWEIWPFQANWGWRGHQATVSYWQPWCFYSKSHMYSSWVCPLRKCEC